jgi:hypothetical protein
LRKEPDAAKRMDFLLKFQLGVSHMVSEKNIDQGIDIFYYSDVNALPRSFSKLLYLLYKQGVFDSSVENINKFEQFIGQIYHKQLNAWLMEMQRRENKTSF